MRLLDYSAFRKFLRASGADVSLPQVGSNSQWQAPYAEIRRFFGAEAIDPASIRIETMSSQFDMTDSTLAEYSREMQEYLRQDGRLFDGPPAVHVAGEAYNIPDPLIRIQPCDYGLQAGTNFALDYEHPLFQKWGGTLRGYVHTRQMESGVNPLPQCLGVCGMLISKKGTVPSVLLVTRSSAVASYENSIGPSAAGSTDFPKTVSTLDSLLKETLAHETNEELGLDEHEFTITPLAMARELFRGGRPQLFGLIETNLSGEELVRRVNAKQCHEVASCWLAAIENGALSPVALDRLNPEATMAWYLAEELFAECEF